MKKIIFFIIFSILFLSCSKEEEWNEDRRVRFMLYQNISWNTNDGDISQINCSIQYSIIGETDTVYLQSVYDFNSSENWNDIYRHDSHFHSLKNYDHLELKLTISCTSHPLNSVYNLIAESEMLLPNNSLEFSHPIYDHSWQRDTLISFNNSDTTINFTWSPPNFN